MRDLFLVKPNKQYEESFKRYVLAYKSINDKFYYNFYKKAIDNFDKYIEDLCNYSKGIGVEPGWVATSSFWLIDNFEVVGVVRVRHKEVQCAGHIGYDISPSYRSRGYGTEILKLAVEKAKEMGIKEPIVTCKSDNIASKKIIEKNKGKFWGIIFDEIEKEKLYKYIIS